MDEKTSEYHLTVNAQKGDKAALEQLLHQLRSSLFAVAYAELNHYHDAQNALADGVLRICKQIGGLQKPHFARAWMFRIVQNEAQRLCAKREFATALDEAAESANRSSESNNVNR